MRVYVERLLLKMSSSAIIYDRQIRLWGLQTQSKILKSKVFLFGYHSGLLEELAKDLVLTGVGTLVIGKYSEYTETSGQPKFVTYLGHDLEELVEEQNDIQIVSRLIETKSFEICCLICERIGCPVAFALNRICRDNNTLFVYAEVIGALGFLILDLGSHYTYHYLNKSSKRASRLRSTNRNEVIALDDSDSDSAQVDNHSYSMSIENERTLEYPTLEQVLSNIRQSPYPLYFSFLAFVRRWKEEYCMTSQDCLEDRQRQFEMFLQLHKIDIKKSELQSSYNFCSFMNVELISVSSCLAGVLGREIVKLISRNEKPIFNTFIFDAFSCLGSIVYIPSTKVDRKRSREDEKEDSTVYDI
ncbi:SUMO-activating enzyme subunit 1 [Galdieria sulphuraria]|nr:SUMO-activating enzyme subunit 1 [Galdieria sulphuraria]